MWDINILRVREARIKKKKNAQRRELVLTLSVLIKLITLVRVTMQSSGGDR